jgi:hypothetical protein
MDAEMQDRRRLGVSPAMRICRRFEHVCHPTKPVLGRYARWASVRTRVPSRSVRARGSRAVRGRSRVGGGNGRSCPGERMRRLSVENGVEDARELSCELSVPETRGYRRASVSLDIGPSARDLGEDRG